MTAQEAKAKQDELAKYFNLGFWYGTNCAPCCGVYPKFMTTSGMDTMCWYECEVCGKRTEKKAMPWIARNAWNAGEFVENQIRMEGFT